MTHGWFPVYRCIYRPGHWLAPTRRDPANRRDAWCYLISMATHTERETARSGVLGRGEFVSSLRTMGEHLCWSKDRVKRFVSDLETRTAIETVRETPDGTVYHIVNYDTYAVGWDGERDTERDRERDRSETEARQEQEGENNTNKPIGGSSGRSSRLPSDWSPTAGHIERAKDAGLDVIREAEKFRSHAEENGRKAKVWNAAFTRWLINAEEYAKPKLPSRPRQNPLHSDRLGA